mmetsp:Transcript_44601/g.129732  ORF Transcript_44601/g.129732 Transcript_44601/m.129732 type:complete len:216 (+) Transcript_44601:316-963(+)
MRLPTCTQEVQSAGSLHQLPLLKVSWVRTETSLNALLIIPELALFERQWRENLLMSVFLYCNSPESTKTNESAWTPASNTVSLTDWVKRRTACEHSRDMATALFLPYLQKKGCLRNVGSQISNAISLVNCSDNVPKRTISDSRSSRAADCDFHSTKDMIRKDRSGEIARPRRYLRKPMTCRRCFQLSCRSCVTAAVMLDRNEDNTSNAKMMTTTV